MMGKTVAASSKQRSILKASLSSSIRTTLRKTLVSSSVLKARRAKTACPATWVRLARSVPLAQMVPQDRKAPKVRLVCPRLCPVLKAQLVPLALPVPKVRLARLRLLLVRLVPLARLALLVRLVLKAFKARLAQPGLLGRTDGRFCRALPILPNHRPAPMVISILASSTLLIVVSMARSSRAHGRELMFNSWAQPEPRAILATLVPKVSKVRLVSLDPRVILARRVFKARLVSLDPRAILASKVFRAFKVSRVILAILVLKVRLV